MRWWVESTVVGKGGEKLGENSEKIVKGRPSGWTVESRVDGERGRESLYETTIAGWEKCERMERTGEGLKTEEEKKPLI